MVGIDKNTFKQIFYEHWDAFNGTSGGEKVFNAGMAGMKASVYEGGHRVPCFIHWPAGGFNEPIDIDRLTNHFDLLPTLLELCSLKSPSRGHLAFDGRSLVPLMKKTKANWPNRTVFMHQQNVRENPVKWTSSLVMTDKWRLIHGKELYDIKGDPGQKKDVAGNYPEIVTDLRQQYERYWDELNMSAYPYPRPVIGSGYDDETWLAPDAWIIQNEKGPHTYNQIHILDGAVNSGFWPIELAADAIYQFDVRRWPKELDHPISASLPPAEHTDIDSKGHPVRLGKGKAIPAEKVELVIGTKTLEKAIRHNDTNATFDVAVKKGPAEVRAWLIDAEGNKRAAYYIYVKRKP